MVQALRDMMGLEPDIHNILWAFSLTPIASLDTLAGVDRVFPRARNLILSRRHWPVSEGVEVAQTKEIANPRIQVLL
jgi:hypothetical protein